MANHTLQPSPALLAKLGSVCVHVDEMLSDDGHAFDRIALDTVVQDGEVKRWIAEMQAMASVPLRHS